MKNIKKFVLILTYIILFIIGILFILESDSWNLGSIISMTIAGTIMSVFGMIGIFIELYISKK